MSALFAIILTLLAIFLILLVLVQRGRGGGLAGALGGMGGSSAFGAKAGDVFTRITIITAAIWIAISIIAFFWAKNRGDALGRASSAPAANQPMDIMPQQKPGDTSATTASPPAEKSEPAPAASAPATTSPPAESSATPPAATETAPPAENE
ncbi:MAG: preprotein translocase subunit SecG [Planctomycetes bacterium]|nr:preprotein translocase subunit SecG [Planctomycetota bacterium]